MSEAIRAYGWGPKPRDPNVFLREKVSADPAPVLVESIRLPDTPLANKALDYAKQELNTETFNHSMRVFYYGTNGSFSPNRSYGG